MNSYYNLKFKTYTDKTATIRVPKAKLVNPSIIKAAMQKILDSDVISVSAGILKSLDCADFVNISATMYEYEE